MAWERHLYLEKSEVKGLMSPDSARMDTLLDRGPTGAWGLSTMKPVFIGGCDRSGTTLLGAILGTHPQGLCVPEMPFKFGLQRSLDVKGGQDTLRSILTNWRFRIWGLDLEPDGLGQEAPTVRQVVEWIVQEYGQQHGKPDPKFWVDHTPRNIQHAQELIEQFPDAKIIHIVRDGRAVAASVMKVNWGPNRVDHAAHLWVDSLARGFATEIFCGPDRVMRINYEDLVQNAEPTLRKLCGFLGIEYQPTMIEATGFNAPRYTQAQHLLIGAAPNPLRANAWEKELTPRQIEIFESIAGELLLFLGYPVRFSAGAKRIRRSERFICGVQDLFRKTLNWYKARQRIRIGLS